MADQPRAVMRVSVVIATYNRCTLLPATLRSVREQTQPPLEIIVIDDGSTDATQAVVADLALGVRYVKIPNQGPLAARRLGISMAVGELVAVVDDDDLWLPDKLERQSAAMQRTRRRWSYGDAIAFDHDSGTDLYRYTQICQAWDGDIAKPLSLVNFIPGTVLIERTLLRAINDLPGLPALRYAEDWMLWMLIAADHPVARVPEVVGRIRIHRLSASARTDLLQRLADCLTALAFCAQIHERYRQLLPRARRFARLKTLVGLLAQRQLGKALWLSGSLLRSGPVVLIDIVRIGWSMGLPMIRSKIRVLRPDQQAADAS